MWITAVNTVAAATYVYMQFFYTPPALIIVAQFAWVLSHGSPPLVYLIMNRTIRRDCARLLLGMLGETERLGCGVSVTNNNVVMVMSPKLMGSPQPVARTRLHLSQLSSYH